MQIYVARLNIEHFRQLIATETDLMKLDLLRRLMAEEEAKLARCEQASKFDLAKSAPINNLRRRSALRPCAASQPGNRNAR